jgi:thioredoxin reductase (NADPH)
MSRFIFLILAAFAFSQEEVLVLGGGIGSLTSAIYLSRAGLQPIVIEGPTPGGLIIQSLEVQNWPGEMEITGIDLANKVRAQAVVNGAKIYREEVVGVDFSKKPYVVTTREVGGKKTTERKANAIIIGMGTRPNYLGVKGEQDYWGKGVYNCAVCDGALYRGKKVGVVGGGDSAVLEALYLSNIAKEVVVFVRGEALKGIEEKRIATLKDKANVKLLYNTSVTEITGNGKKVIGVTLKDGRKEALDGLFLAIGSTPNSELFKGILKMDSRGYISLMKGQETSIEGIYAIGDIVDPEYKQAITAAGDGAKAALQVERRID